MKLPRESGDDLLKQSCLEPPLRFDPVMKNVQKHSCFARFYTSTDRFQTVLRKHVFYKQMHHSRAVCMVLRFMSRRAPKRAKNTKFFSGLGWCVLGVSRVILRSSSCALRACAKSFVFYAFFLALQPRRRAKPRKKTYSFKATSLGASRSLGEHVSNP